MSMNINITRRGFVEAATTSVAAATLGTPMPHTFAETSQSNPRKGRNEDPGFVPMSWD